MVYTLPYAISQAFLIPRIGYYFTSENVLKISAVFCGIWLLILLFPHNYLMLYITLPIQGILMSFCSTNIAVLVSDSANQNNQGQVLGVSQSLRVFNDGAIVLVGGVLAMAAADMPLLIGGIAIVFAGTLLFF